MVSLEFMFSRKISMALSDRRREVHIYKKKKNGFVRNSCVSIVPNRIGQRNFIGLNIDLGTLPIY